MGRGGEFVVKEDALGGELGRGRVAASAAIVLIGEVGASRACGLSMSVMSSNQADGIVLFYIEGTFG